MRSMRAAVQMFSVGMMVLATGVASSQPYPNKPIRIVTTQVGGGGDVLARIIQPDLASGLDQPVVIDNRTSGIIPGSIVAKALPDGYTLLFSSGILWIGALMQEPPYDPVRDFSPITAITSSPNILVVQPSLGVTSVKELIALAKAKPGTLNFSSAGAGGSTHLAAEMFKTMTGVNIVRIFYKGAGAANSALLSGEVQLEFASPGGVVPLIKAGRLRALAVTSARRSKLYPDLPTIAEAGLPGYEWVTINGVLAPSAVPETITDKLHREIVRVINQPKIKNKLFSLGLETIGNSPKEFAAVIKSDTAKWAKVIKDAGLRTE